MKCSKPVYGILLLVLSLASIFLDRSVFAQSTVADPTLLPVATTSQMPNTAAYDALGVPSLAAGDSYLDPTTGVRIYKLTSATYPTSTPTPNCHPAPWWGHDYFEGGDEVSLPYDGNTRTILVWQDPDCGGPHWLIDFTPGVGLSNARELTGAIEPWADLAFAFSNNPATPFYAYVSTVGTGGSCVIRRIDIRTNPLAEVPGNGWPLTDSASSPNCAAWLHQSEDDGLFVWMRGLNGTTAVGYQPSTGTLRTHTDPNLNEPRIDRAGRYVALTVCPNNPCGFSIWDWETNSIVWEQRDGYDPNNPNVIPWGHVASLKDRWMYVDTNMSFPYEYTRIIPDVTNSQAHLGGPTNGPCVDGDGNWIQSPTNLDDQWALFINCGGLQPTQGSGWLAPGGMIFTTIEPDAMRYLLGHSYNTSTAYHYSSFPKLSPDGQYVLFTSDMDGSGRSDVFLAQVPTRSENFWTALVNATPDGDSITKTSGCDGCEDAGAISVQQINSGNGYVQFDIGSQMIFGGGGLNHDNTGTSLNDLDFGFLFSQGHAEVIENGSYVGGDTTYVTGDVFRVSIVGSQIEYSKNGTILLITTASPTYPLFLDVTLGNIGDELTNAAVVSSP